MQEFPKWVYPEGNPPVLVNSAGEEADAMRAPSAAAAKAKADADAKAAKDKADADAAAKVASDAADAADQAAKRGPGRPSNAEIAARQQAQNDQTAADGAKP